MRNVDLLQIKDWMTIIQIQKNPTALFLEKAYRMKRNKKVKKRNNRRWKKKNNDENNLRYSYYYLN